MKKSNRKKFLQFVVLVLFLAALFVPQDANRLLIAGMTDLELDVWDAWLRERQEHLEETLSNISPSEEPCRYYLLTGYIQGMLEALTMLTTVEDGKRFKIKLEQFRQNLLLSGDYDATGNYKQAVKKTAV